jgi:hypothetical protein
LRCGDDGAHGRLDRDQPSFAGHRHCHAPAEVSTSSTLRLQQVLIMVAARPSSWARHRGTLGSGMKPRVYLETSVISYLVGWLNQRSILVAHNCKHIVNGNILPQVYSVCRASGFDPPLICTPSELM